MDYRDIAEQIFLEGVKRVIPDVLINRALTISNNTIVIGQMSFPLARINNIYVIGAGKAGAIMATEVEKILGDRIRDGHVAVKYGHSARLKHIRITEAGHPEPDSNGFRATGAILDIADKAVADDLVICLLSGGGSALLPDFPEGSSPEDIVKITGLLINSGACISEINAVRKHLSNVKGGQLARRVFPATLISLILSDVPGDPQDVIASGPTVPDPTTFQQAIDVLEKYNLVSSAPSGIVRHLKNGADGKIPETPKPEDILFESTYNLLIGTNRLALEAAKLKALEFNINSIIVDDKLQGDTLSVSEYLVETALRFKTDENEVKPVCLLFGGETTVKMTGSGVGGRNQHLALLCALLLEDHPGITILAAGSDGTDGPTKAAGAVVDAHTLSVASKRKIDPLKYISRFDSYNFFRNTGGHIITGPTRTNVMDIIVVIVA